MNKFSLFLVMMICAVFTTNAQTKKQMFDAGAAMAQESYEHALTTGNEDSIKIAKKHLKKFDPVKKVAMPIYMYNPQLQHSAGLSTMLVYSLDKNMASPWSMTSLTFAKSLSTPGWMLNFNNWQYLKEDKWRFQETGTILNAQMDATIPLGADFSGISTVDAEVYFVALRGYRKVADNLYVGPKLGYNRTIMNFSAVKDENGEAILIDGEEIIIPSSENTLFGLGTVLDYDTRDKKQYPTKGFYAFNEFSYQTSALGYKATDPSSGSAYVDPTAAYFVGDLKKYYSPSNSWHQVFSMRLKYDFRVGDVGSSQWSGNTSYQRGFKNNTVQGGYSLTLNAQYDHFFKNFLNGRFGVDVFASTSTFGQNGFAFKYNGDTESGIAEGITAGVGAGLQYMVMPQRGMVLRADFGCGFTPGSSFDMQFAPSIGIGRFF